MSSRLVLVLGDLFIPDRAIDIPAKFKKLLSNGKIGQILCLGNLTSPSVYAWLRSIAPELHLVKGDFDIALAPPPPSAPVTAGNDAATAPPPPASAAAFPIPAALSKVITHGSLRIGFTHGDTILPPGDPDALLIAARQMDVDVLCWGGGTCRFEAYEMEGKFFVNPGSATGAPSWMEEEDPEQEDGGNTPSFVLLDVQGDVLVLYVYQLRKGADGNETVGVEKVSFRKNAPVVSD